MTRCPDDLVGNWTGQGVYFRTDTDVWKKMSVPAELVAVGDLDGDGTADLAGNYAAQGGIWIELSSTQAWSFLGSSARDIFAGQMDGDAAAELIGTWDGQGVYYMTAVAGSWVKIATPAEIIAAGDMDGDNKDDLLGIWPGQGGVWVKYSSTNQWAKLSATATDITAGLMRAGGNSWFAQAEEFEPMELEGPGYGNFKDLSSSGPGGSQFQPTFQISLIPQESGTEPSLQTAGPGEPGFWCIEQDNQVPGIVREAFVRPRVPKERRINGDK